MRFHDWSIRRKLVTGFFCIAMILLGAGLMQLGSLGGIGDKQQAIVRASGIVDSAMFLQLYVSEDMRMIMEMLEAQTQADLDMVWVRHIEFRDLIARYGGRLAADSSMDEDDHEAHAARAVKEATARYEGEFLPLVQRIREVKGAVLNGGWSDAMFEDLGDLDGKADGVGEDIIKRLDEALDLTRQEMKEAEQDGSRYMSRIKVLLVLGIVAAMVASILMGAFIAEKITTPLSRCVDLAGAISHGDLSHRVDSLTHKDETGRLMNSLGEMTRNLRNMLKDVKEATDQIASSAEELSATTAHLAEGARSQSLQTDQAATAMLEMSETVIEVAKNAGEVSEAAGRTSAIAAEGRQKVIHTVEGMRRISETVNAAAETIGHLGRSSEQIGQIVNTINDIADQTNLLALNAAIEAARAGDLGRGFAVVADEVRKLAERTGRATKEIEDMIGKIQDDTRRSVASMSAGREDVDRGLRLAEEAMASLVKIVESSDHSADMVQRIATATEQQSSAVEEVSTTIESIAGITHESQAASKQIEDSSRGLSMVASRMKQTVDRFRL